MFRFYRRVLFFLPAQVIIWLVFIRAFQEFGLLIACLFTAAVILLLAASVMGSPLARRGLVWYLNRLCVGCPSEAHEACTRVSAACPRSHKLFIDRFEKAWKRVRLGLCAAVLRMLRLGLWLVMPLVVFAIAKKQHWPAPFTFLSGLREGEVLEFGALIGMLGVVAVAFWRLRDQTLKNARLCFLIAFFVFIAVCVGTFGIFSRPPHANFHLVAVLAASVLLGVFDCFALYGTQQIVLASHTTAVPTAEETRTELLLMCVIVDAPVVVALIGAAFYWYSLGGNQAADLLAGAVSMQFLTSAILFALVQEGIIEKVLRSRLSP